MKTSINLVECSTLRTGSEQIFVCIFYYRSYTRMPVASVGNCNGKEGDLWRHVIKRVQKYTDDQMVTGSFRH
jgi:hypothetical protein